MASVTATHGAVLFDQGPINGTIDAWTINFDYAVANSFALSQASTVTGVNFGAWSLPGDTMLTVDWTITAAPDAFADEGTATVSTSYLYTNGYGYDVSLDSFSIPGQHLAAGTYWLVLQNATVTNGDPIFWDENDGLSLAYENTVGQIGSESFQISGTTVPEPSTWAMMLLGFTGLGYAAFRRAGKARGNRLPLMPSSPD
jgi:PEP-CTERM motif